jgi:type VI secretion system protein ImpA
MDFEPMLHPLEGNAGPCGEDMIFSTEFDAIQDARRFDDPTLSQGEWVTDVKEADWDRVVDIGGDLLTNRTKDLRIAIWMTEAWTKLHGLSGLADGYTLLARLCEAFWPDLHPQPEDGDMEARIGNLDWLMSQTIQLVREIPLTKAARGAFSMVDYETARAVSMSMERHPDQADEMARNARLTLPDFEAARRDTAPDYFLSGMRQAESAKAAVEKLKQILDELMGNDSPVFSGVLEVLDDLHAAYRRYAGETGALAGDSAAAAVESGSAGQDEPSSQPRVAGPIQTREQALRQLHEIAVFFKRTEPHSPVAYLAEKAAKWGTMPLHEWLRSVVKDDTALLRVEELLGVESPKPDHEEG